MLSRANIYIFTFNHLCGVSVFIMVSGTEYYFKTLNVCGIEIPRFSEIDILEKIINFGVHYILWLKLMRNIVSELGTVVILLY